MTVTFFVMLTCGYSWIECLWFAIAWTPKVHLHATPFLLQVAPGLLPQSLTAVRRGMRFDARQREIVQGPWS